MRGWEMLLMGRGVGRGLGRDDSGGWGLWG